MPATPAELIQIESRHSVYLEGLKTHEVNELRGFLKEMDADIRKRLGGKDLTAFTRARLERLLSRVAQDIAIIMTELSGATVERAVALGVYESGFEQRALSEVVINYDFDTPTAGQVRSAIMSAPLMVQGPAGGLLMEGFLASTSTDVQNRLTAAIRLGYAQGETTPQILQRLRGTRARGFKDGALGVVNRNIEAAVRTSLQHAASQGRQATWNNSRDIVKEVMWVSSLDGRTSVTCQSLDGRRFPIDSGPRPPIHYNCRSTTAAVLDERFATLEQGATRAARDPATGRIESVPAKQSYYAWLKNQPEAFQNSVIGKGRAKLLRDGGLSTQRFSELQLDKTFKPRTLDQIRELEPVAFNRMEAN